MSEVYIRRLRAVRDEFDAARLALLYVIRHWQAQDTGNDPEVARSRFTVRPFEQAQISVEQTYFIRLYAEFEGVLKDHLATNHPVVRVPDKPRVDWLINRVIQVESFAIESPLRAKMDAVRDYRNFLAHRKQKTVPAVVTFTDALSRLNTFLARLPEPLD